MRDPKGIVGRAAGEPRGTEANAGKSRGLDVRFASGADAAVSRRLKEMYDGLVSEPVPDRFLDLLSQLDQVDTPAGDQASKPSGTPEAPSAGPASDTPVPGMKP